MIHFYISGQSIRFTSPVIAANSLDYLEAEFHFSGSTWDGCSKWAHFRQNSTVFDLNLVDDKINAEMHLNLSLGNWEVYVTGTRSESRLTTVPVVLTVAESGLVDEPLHQIPQSVAEQIDAKAALALQKAKTIESDAANGRFNGKNFQIMGYFSSINELELSALMPEAGDAYGIGTGSPYDIYVYDPGARQWVNNGSIQGPAGDKGSNGATFTPQLDGNGNLSWINNGGLANPAVVNIMGPQGAQGKTGADGKSPYQLAVETGFTGTEATFNSALATIAAHGAKHGMDGTDPLPRGSIGTDMLATGAVTAGKLAEGAVSTVYTATAPVAGWTGSAAPYSNAVTVTGLLETDSPIADLTGLNASTAEAAQEAWGYVYKVVATANTLTLYAIEKPAVTLTLLLRVVRK